MSRLAADSESAGMMKDALVVLEDSGAYRLVVKQMELLLAQDRRSLETTHDHSTLLQLQGQVKARARDITMIQELVRRLNNEMAGDVPVESEKVS